MKTFEQLIEQDRNIKTNSTIIEKEKINEFLHELRSSLPCMGNIQDRFEARELLQYWANYLDKHYDEYPDITTTDSIQKNYHTEHTPQEPDANTYTSFLPKKKKCRKFLFLQGMATPFFKELSLAIKNQGHSVYRINFCGGDLLFSSRNIETWNFTLPLNELPSFFHEKNNEHSFTDIILFGDTRPVHRYILREVDKKTNINVHVYDEGYIRPNWITLEQIGVNGYSELLKKPTNFWKNRKNTKPANSEDIYSGTTLGIRLWHDIKYRIANAIASPYYHHYVTHRPYSALREYYGWIIRFSKLALYTAKKDNKIIKSIINNTPYYLLPLQLQSDPQVQVHSKFNSITSVISEVMHSFSKYAPKNTLLIIKRHPIDPEIIDYKNYSSKLSIVLGIQDRVVFIDSGHLPTLLSHTNGTIIVNSAIGTSALFYRSPLISLGTAIYDMPGLTFQDGLDRFWKEGKKPNKRQNEIFRELIIEATQLPGNFYSNKGRKILIEKSLETMHIKPVTQTSSHYENSVSQVDTNAAPLDLLEIKTIQFILRHTKQRDEQTNIGISF